MISRLTADEARSRAERVRELVAAGESVRAIADRLGMGESVLRRLMSVYGIPKPESRRGRGIHPKRHPTADQRARAIAVANELGAHHAARILGVHERTIVRWRNGHLKKAAQ